MNIYIDKSNLLSIARSAKIDNYHDCMRMLKKYFNIHFTFPSDDIKSMSLLEKQDIMLWLTQMTSGINEANKNHIKWSCGFPSKRPLDLSTFNSEQLTSVFCLSNNGDPKLVSQENKGNLIIAYEGQEIEALSSLFFEDYQFNEDVFHKITSWDDLNNYTSPCTDIIIADSFIFSSPDLYSDNIYSIIKALTRTVKSSKVNIVIFTLKSNYDRITDTNFEPDWDTIYSKIRKCAGKHSSFNVTFVTASKGTLEEHDRTIFTNYKSIASGDSYNYFNSSGDKITNGRYLNIFSHAKESNENKMKIFISDMQSIIKSIKSKNNDSLIKKDKISNFLEF